MKRKNDGEEGKDEKEKETRKRKTMTRKKKSNRRNMKWQMTSKKHKVYDDVENYDD